MRSRINTVPALALLAMTFLMASPGISQDMFEQHDAKQKEAAAAEDKSVDGRESIF